MLSCFVASLRTEGQMRPFLTEVFAWILEQVGAELVFRVLGCKSKRVTVTHKKTLVCFYA